MMATRVRPPGMNYMWECMANINHLLYLNDQVWLSYNNEKSNMGPCKQRKLSHVVSLTKRYNKPYEASNVPKNEIRDEL